MRASFIAAADRLVDVPPWAQRLLRQIPPAALAAIVVPALMRPEGELDLTHPRFLAGIVAGLVAWRTNNVLATLAVGMGLVVLLPNL
jgi:branched-subunit amino acid transport protein